MELLLPHDQLNKTKKSSLARANEFVDKRILSTIMYHDIFGYPLTQSELIKWEMKESSKLSTRNFSSKIKFKNGYYFLEGKDGLVFKRTMRGRISQKKTIIAHSVVRLLSKIPTIKLVALTGSLAMQNANENSDIDLMIVTKSGTLWLSRLLSYVLLKLTNYQLRKPADKNEKDKLCLNIWMDEQDLFIEKHNIYTAHEIAQIVPLVNKNKTYEKLMETNSWVNDYWPNAVKINNKLSVERLDNKKEFQKQSPLLSIFESIAFNFQFNFMKRKITHEVVTPTRAFFHPYDWSEFVSSQGF